ncbi:MAG TPA: FtsQ-type POTRA domain-containing protein [Candidatus Eisenbergiella merdipullorum]|uniref:FtsQ-type POTRA domain-containing protein n=1 Tax=Candidatus Eisenbergiella merdipullorum TaxID=2838553 RepID=A0A9D2L082_9FIRM|nr:FtsQ-type POTRA domain-containing protein [Candidatus Eisenbergiella merdipullorum]
MLLGTAAVLTAAFLFILKYFHVNHIYVEGNLHYTSDEIIQMVTGGRFGDNSLFLSLKYRDRGMEGIPFIETMDVEVLAPDTIRIIVYEKSVAGYVKYLDRYMYFDRDGIVVEVSETKTEGIPEITGIDFSQVVLYEPLPVENQNVFREILSITQILSKYGLSADKIYFDNAGEMTLYFGQVRAKLGNSGNVEEKVARLQQLLPSAEGKKGVFRLENYSGSGENVSFELDDQN